MTHLAFILASLLTAAQPSGEIALVRDAQDAAPRVCLFNLDSKTLTPVGQEGVVGVPVWSPDGTQLAFEIEQGEGCAICVADVNVGTSFIISHQYMSNRYPRWSPDSASLAYTSGNGQDGKDQRIIVYNVASSTEEQWGGEASNLMRPVWMPSNRLLYALRPGEHVEWGGESGNLPEGIEWLAGEQALLAVGWGKDGVGHATTDIYFVTRQFAAAPEAILPSKGTYAEWAAEPSPRGDSVAFESNDGGDREIFVLTRRGAADVTNHAAADWNPVWSPNGEWIAFESLRSGRRGVHRVYAQTGRISELAVTEGSDNWWPTWAPDSHSVAFVSTRNGRPKVFVSDLHNDTVLPLTDDAVAEYAPAWRPVPKAKKGKS